MDIKEIQNLIRFVAKSGVNEVKLEIEDIKITIKTGSSKTETTILQANPMAAMSQVPVQEIAPITIENSVVNSAVVDENSHYITVKSPIIGTFYRKSAPDKPSFVEVGKSINIGDTVCVIEAMKLFNEIESEVSGTVVKILVDDSSPVEFDQPLFLVDPS
jgi:acetyl-CoA carboxylase biotin carboxyl carrier protein